MKQPQSFKNLTSLVDGVLSVSKETIKEREKIYRAEMDSRPTKRGPKKKQKPAKASASRDLDAQASFHAFGVVIIAS